MLLMNDFPFTNPLLYSSAINSHLLIIRMRLVLTENGAPETSRCYQVEKKQEEEEAISRRNRNWGLGTTWRGGENSHFSGLETLVSRSTKIERKGLPDRGSVSP